MKISQITKRLWYFTLAVGWLTWNTLEAFARATYKTLYLGERIYWVYSKNVTPEEAGVAVVNNHVTGETYLIPDESVAKPKKVNKYHLRYNYSSRGAV